MSHVTHSAALETAKPTQDLQGDGFAASEALEWLWRTFTSMRTALILILCLSVLALIGTLLVQAPPGLASDPQAYDAWLVGLKPRYGGFTTILDKLGLFAVFQSIWFRAIIVGLTTSIMACSVNRFRGLWKTAVHPRMRMTDRFYAQAPIKAAVESAAAPEAALETTRRIFRHNHYRTVVLAADEPGELPSLYVDKRRWAPFGTLIGHLSLVLILLGALVGSMFGFRNNEFAATVGTTVDVGGGSNLQLMARSFSDSYYATTGAPSDYASDIVLMRDGQQVAQQTIRVNEPLSYDGTTFYQSFFGPAAVMQVSRADGSVAYSGGVPLLWSSDDSSRRIGRFSLDDAGLTVFVVGAASGRVDPAIKAGQMQLEVYRAGEQQPFAIEVISQNTPFRIGELDFTFQREQQFTGLIVARDPGAVLVWLGALALVTGLFMVFMFPNRRIWVALKARADGGSEVVLGATARHDATFAPEFEKVVEQVRLALAPAV
jgi:cytochrome c biogenesis protein